MTISASVSKPVHSSPGETWIKISLAVNFARHKGLKPGLSCTGVNLQGPDADCPVCSDLRYTRLRVALILELLNVDRKMLCRVGTGIGKKPVVVTLLTYGLGSVVMKSEGEPCSDV